MNYEELKSLALESGFTHTAPLELSSWMWNPGSASRKYLLL